jgi:hypothetical protein
MDPRPDKSGTRAFGTDSANVVVLATGAVYVAPEGTVSPAEATTVLDAAWKSVGYLSEAGIEESIEVSSDSITAWQGAAEVRRTITGYKVSLKFTMIETNSKSVGLYYGKAVAAAATSHGIGGGGGAGGGGRLAFVVDGLDSAGQHIRRFIPSGEVIERGAVTLSGSDALAYEVTLAAYGAPELAGDAVKAMYGQALA